VIFVDTGAWFASFVPTDADHAVARAWLVRNQAPLLTTDYVIDELLALMRMRGENRRALRVGQSLLDQGLAELHLAHDGLALGSQGRQYARRRVGQSRAQHSLKG
jgi:uncharacterized protein